MPGAEAVHHIRSVDPINAEPLNGRVEVALPEIQRTSATKVEISQHRVDDTPTEAVAQTKERHTPLQRLSTSSGTAQNRTKRRPARMRDLKVGHEGRKRRPGLSTIRSPSTSLPLWVRTTSSSRGCELNCLLHRTSGSRRCSNDLMSNAMWHH